MKKKIGTLAAILTLSLTTYGQDIMMPSASYKTTIQQNFSTSTIELEYSRPSAKGRAIFGEVVPFDKPWRTGANAITKITFKEEIIFGDKKVAPGSYALYTVPSKDAWEVRLNTKHNSSGLNDIDAKNDVATLKVTPITTDAYFETFAIIFNNLTYDQATIDIMWENTIVRIPIKADNQKRIIDHLTKRLESNKPPYREAAYYFYEVDYKLELALEYTDKAIIENQKAFWLYAHKAKILLKLNQYEEAIKAAQKAVDLTQGTGFEQEYKHKLEEVINSKK